MSCLAARREPDLGDFAPAIATTPARIPGATGSKLGKLLNVNDLDINLRLSHRRGLILKDLRATQAAIGVPSYANPGGSRDVAFNMLNYKILTRQSVGMTRRT